MNHRLPELTGLRCIAVMMVVIGHAEHMVVGGYTGLLMPLRLFASGDLGVVIFFVLSGFLITGLLQAEWKNTGSIKFLHFYIRRILRIWPAFYVYLMVIGALAAAGMIDVAPRQFLYGALHLWNYSALLGLGPTDLAHPSGVWYLGHFWTLALEEQFYWFWPPLLLFILRHKNQRLLPFLILFVPVIRIGSYFAMPAFRGQLEMMFHTGIDSILIGCYVALNKDRLMKMIDSWPRSSTILTILILVLLFLIPIIESRVGGYWTATYGRTIEAAIAGIMILFLTMKQDFWYTRILRTRIFVFIGEISFSLYLWQQLFSNITSPLALRFPFGILEAIAAATLSYWLIELPFLRLKDSLGKKRRHRAAEIDSASV